MLIFKLITTLGIVVLFSENPALDCGTKYADACTNENKIVLILNGKGDMNENLYHEMGHNMFHYDQYVKAFIAPYPAPRYYFPEIYDTPEKQLNEKVADYFAMSRKYSDFPDKFPEINALFDKKIDMILSHKFYE